MEGDAPRGVSLVQSQSQSLTVEEEKIWKKKFSTETALRRTPGLSSAGTESSSSKPTLPKIRASTKLEAKPLHPWVGAGVINLRRSPRFTLQTKEDVDDDFLRQCSKKCSKNFLQPNGVHNIELNSDGCGLSNSFDEQQPFKRIKTFSENSDLGMSDNKFLRQSRRISSSAFRVQNGKTNASSVELPKSARKHSPKNKSDKQHSPEKIKPMSSKKKQKKHKSICSLIGDPVPHNEAQERWHWRYEIKAGVLVSPPLKEEGQAADRLSLQIQSLESSRVGFTRHSYFSVLLQAPARPAISCHRLSVSGVDFASTVQLSVLRWPSLTFVMFFVLHLCCRFARYSLNL
ncbi:hypothetical protein JCGZ_12202 [Jatropha curcas]|uniref:Uncharacterized protein n=1 Tax=Jatropha curcas TaxID=180498 RepID=A0A067LH58_JATCU|nr:hypothetical protein JCGZ_12202 [Jatropha curcas]